MPALKNLLSLESLQKLEAGLKRKATETRIKSLKQKGNVKLQREAKGWDDLASR